MAQEAVRVAADRGPLARRVRPALTTVHQDVTPKGRTAAALLIAAIEAGRTGEPAPTDQVVLPTELVLRESTSAPHTTA